MSDWHAKKMAAKKRWKPAPPGKAKQSSRNGQEDDDEPQQRQQEQKQRQHQHIGADKQRRQDGDLSKGARPQNDQHAQPRTAPSSAAAPSSVSPPSSSVSSSTSFSRRPIEDNSFRFRSTGGGASHASSSSSSSPFAASASSSLARRRRRDDLDAVLLAAVAAGGAAIAEQSSAQQRWRTAAPPQKSRHRTSVEREWEALAFLSTNEGVAAAAEVDYDSLIRQVERSVCPILFLFVGVLSWDRALVCRCCV
jgi:hypothetical protein